MELSELANFCTLQRRQEELERKAQELERREEQLRNSAAGIRRNNWPPLPEQCCFQPCFYQDINVEIPVEFQRIVRHLYYLWGFYALVLSTNALVALLLMFRGQEHGFGHFVLGLIYGALFTPASFMCWYVSLGAIATLLFVSICTFIYEYIEKKNLIASDYNI